MENSLKYTTEITYSSIYSNPNSQNKIMSCARLEQKQRNDIAINELLNHAIYIGEQNLTDSFMYNIIQSHL